MTRKEAIQILKSMSDISTQGEAIDMAIEALSADTVSRTHGRLIDADTIVTIQVFDEMYEEYNIRTMSIEEALDLWTEEGCPPTVEVGRPHGEWIPQRQKCEYRCNICGKIVFADDENELNYCCNCGADMRTEQTEYLDKTFPNHDGEWYDVTDMLTEYKLPFHDEIMEKLDKMTLRGDKDV